MLRFPSVREPGDTLCARVIAVPVQARRALAPVKGGGLESGFSIDYLPYRSVARTGQIALRGAPDVNGWELRSRTVVHDRCASLARMNRLPPRWRGNQRTSLVRRGRASAGFDRRSRCSNFFLDRLTPRTDSKRECGAATCSPYLRRPAVRVDAVEIAQLGRKRPASRGSSSDPGECRESSPNRPGPDDLRLGQPETRPRSSMPLIHTSRNFVRGWRRLAFTVSFTRAESVHDRHRTGAQSAPGVHACSRGGHLPRVGNDALAGVTVSPLIWTPSDYSRRSGRSRVSGWGRPAQIRRRARAARRSGCTPAARWPAPASTARGTAGHAVQRAG